MSGSRLRRLHKTIVFTGRGITPSGEFKTRSWWEARADAAGWDISSMVRRDTGLLVASRTNTEKAKSATALGVWVVTYAEFLKSTAVFQDDTDTRTLEPAVKVAPTTLAPKLTPPEEQMEDWGSWA